MYANISFYNQKKINKLLKNKYLGAMINEKKGRKFMIRKLKYVFLLFFLIGLSSCAGTNTNLTKIDNNLTTNASTERPTNDFENTTDQTTTTETTTYEITTTEPTIETTTHEITSNFMTTEQPTTSENQKTTQPITEEPTTVQPTETPTEEPTTQEPTTQVPTTQPTSVESTTVEPTTEAPTIHYVTITFSNMAGALGTTSIEGIAGNPFSLPDDPTRSGYVFDGWYLEDTFNTVFNINEFPQNNLTVYAKWQKLITIYFETLNGSSSTPFVTGLPGDSYVLPNEPVRSGYVFDGWYMDQSYTTPLTLSSIPNNDTTVYAKWVEEVTVIDEIIAVLENDFGFTCLNNVCELEEYSWLTYTFNLNNITFTKASIDNDSSGDQQTKTEIVVIDSDWSVEYNVSITYLSTQKASMRVTGNGLTGSYKVRSFSSNYLSESNMYDDAIQFIDGPYGSGAVGLLKYILQAADLTLDDLQS